MAEIIKSKGRNQLIGIKPKKVGIYSGTFDPVHKGHIGFALEAVKSAQLDVIYFMPDMIPHRKEGVTHYAHRLAMLKLALRPYPALRVLEVSDKQFTIARTLPKLKQLFPHDKLHMLMGTDVLEGLRSGHWPYSEKLLEAVKLVVGVRSDTEAVRAHQIIETVQPAATVVETSVPHVSSRAIRNALHAGQGHEDLLTSLKAYVDEHWLYTTVSSA